MKGKLILISIFFIQINLLSQAWVKKKGGGYSQISYSYISASRIYNNNGPVIQLPYNVQDFTYSVYVEYGITNKLTVIGNIPFRSLKTYGDLHLNVKNPTTINRGKLNSFGNIALALNYGIRQNKSFVISAKLNLNLPTATYKPQFGLRTGYDTYGVSPFLNIGYSNKKLFYSLQTGFNIRGNSYSNQFINHFEIGTLKKDKFYYIFGHELLLSMKNGNYNDETTSQTGLSANNTEYLAYSLKFGYKFNSSLTSWLYLSGGYWGNAVLQSPAISLSFSFEW